MKFSTWNIRSLYTWQGNYPSMSWIKWEYKETNGTLVSRTTMQEAFSYGRRNKNQVLSGGINVQVGKEDI
jgi:hypothetical protein